MQAGKELTGVLKPRRDARGALPVYEIRCGLDMLTLALTHGQDANILLGVNAGGILCVNSLLHQNRHDTRTEQTCYHRGLSTKNCSEGTAIKIDLMASLEALESLGCCACAPRLICSPLNSVHLGECTLKHMLEPMHACMHACNVALCYKAAKNGSKALCGSSCRPNTAILCCCCRTS
jgi:hypothetical protein